MKAPRDEQPDFAAELVLSGIAERLAGNQRIRRKLPFGGRLYIERQLPFLCVYRRPSVRPDAGTLRLMVSSASYLIAPAEGHSKRLAALVRQIASLMSQRFHGFLLVEIWSDPDEIGAPLSPSKPKPTFRVVVSKSIACESTVETLNKALGDIRIRKRNAQVVVTEQSRVAPPGLQPLLSTAEAKALNCCLIGLEIQPVFRRPGTGEIFPVLLRSLHRGVDRALKKAYFTFSCAHTSHRPEYYFALGRRAMVKAAWEVDRHLAAVSDSFDLLLQVTPINVDDAWKDFRKRKYQQSPKFHYRPLSIDPAILKRHLFSPPIERIEDATLAQLFHEKQDELDRQITLLADIGTRRFLHGSLQLYGGVDDGLLALAGTVLEELRYSDSEDSARHTLGAQQVAEHARAEIDDYRRIHPDFWATVQVRDDMYPGMMVSQGRLLIGHETRVPSDRVHALLAHEVGVHLLTYFNGLAQPIRQLHTGLAGYDELQEGLAVLSEYLVGGLSPARLRLLAARVLATRLMTDQATFMDTFQLLVDGHRFSPRVAFTVAMRIYRGGGFTKDAVYLRGLAKILDYLHEGGDLAPLFVGKISSAHISMVQELQSRQVLRPVPLRPHYFQDPRALKRLERVRKGFRLLDLIES